MKRADELAVSGLSGFLGWHFRCAARASHHKEVIPIDREAFHNPGLLDKRIAGVRSLVHLAGANRGEPQEVIAVNVTLAERLGSSLRRLEGTGPSTVVFANSIHSQGDTPYGASKRAAAEILESACQDSGRAFSDVVLPHLFGEHGAPNYNSFVATFCAALTRGLPVPVDREVPVRLLHAQRASDILLRALEDPYGAQSLGLSEGFSTTVGDTWDLLVAMRDGYHGAAIPEYGNEFSRALFNTFRSFLAPEAWLKTLKVHSDERGKLVESAATQGGSTHAFFSLTAPGSTRGDHYHRFKFERFVVLQGHGLVRLRRMFDSRCQEFFLDGETPQALDMPTLWAHSIANIGTAPLLTAFFADEVFDPKDPDTYPEVA